MGYIMSMLAMTIVYRNKSWVLSIVTVVQNLAWILVKSFKSSLNSTSSSSVWMFCNRNYYPIINVILYRRFNFRSNRLWYSFRLLVDYCLRRLKLINFSLNYNRFSNLSKSTLFLLLVRTGKLLNCSGSSFYRGAIIKIFYTY